ncbi:MAG: amidohydrolase family protein [Bacillota bacterium]|nr:amidohydrolase family protein [Bacillota bacterium]
MKQQYDIVIEGGLVCSFEPDQLSVRNIGIKNGKVEAISTEPLSAKTRISAFGKVVSPGFIDFHSHVDGKEFSAGCLVRQGATTTIGGERNLDGGAIRNIEENGFLINHGFYISHSFTLRQAAGIDDPYRAATPNELSTMVRLADQFLEHGAFGLHFGLEFVPGTSYEEFYTLAKVAQNRDKVALVHLRDDGVRTPGALGEAIRVAKETGVSMHILHLHYMSGFGDLMDETIRMIDDANRDGCDITVDTGMYTAFPSCAGASILDEGWTEKYKEGTQISDLMVSSGIYSGTKCNYQMLDFLREEFPNTLVIGFTFEEKAIREILQKDYTFVSTNAADGPHYDKVGHPETAGSFPRLIRKYVKETDTLSLQDAIRKITVQPARRFGLPGKGNIEIGGDADIVIFDLNRIRERADFVDRGDPNAAPDGIECVLVNGRPVILGGEMTGEYNAGRLLTSE